MDLIEGRPIVDYCDANRLSIPGRLELFLQVCGAVQYAHQRLIIHRDIKPGNILVTSNGTPKLLDFGIAKVFDSDERAQGDETLTALRALTPEYASPEQISGEPVTTASDVYSLGVVLFALLTGSSPYPITRNVRELASMICEREPDRPSAVVARPSAKNGAEPVSVEQLATARGSTPHKLHKQLQGDLDNIVLMALGKSHRDAMPPRNNLPLTFGDTSTAFPSWLAKIPRATASQSSCDGTGSESWPRRRWR